MTERDQLGQAPTAGEDAADQRVVDAELAALAVDALLGGTGVAVHLAGIARVGVHEDELADVVQQRGHHEAVAVLVAGLDGEAIGGALGGDAVEAKALGRGVPHGRALEEVEGAGAGGEALDRLGREQLDGLDDRLDPPARAALDLVGQPEDRDHQGDVGLDGGDDVAGRDPVGRDEAQEAIARLGQGREVLERLEGSRQTTAMALVVAALCAGGLGGCGTNGLDVGGRRGHIDRVRAFACVLGKLTLPLSAGVDGCLSPRPIELLAGQLLRSAARRRCAPAPRRARAPRGSRRCPATRSSRPARRAPAGRHPWP
jgi:hypothetical protein